MKLLPLMKVISNGASLVSLHKPNKRLQVNQNLEIIIITRTIEFFPFELGKTEHIINQTMQSGRYNIEPILQAQTTNSS